MMTIVVIALTTQIIITAHIHAISCRRDSNPDSPGSVTRVITTEPSAGSQGYTFVAQSGHRAI